MFRDPCWGLATWMGAGMGPRPEGVVPPPAGGGLAGPPFLGMGRGFARPLRRARFAATD